MIDSLWEHYYKEPLDEIPFHPKEIFNLVKRRFFQSSWIGVYDLLEFVPSNYRYPNINSDFRIYCSNVLEREFAAYRFVGEKIIQNTSEQEIDEIEKALVHPLSQVQFHLKTAIGHLSNRENPDYRNVIKESISAVEALCIKIDNSGATLGKTLGVIEKKTGIKIPVPLRLAFEQLYGYTSTSDGIRHALTELPNTDWEDAMFMLVSCSGFINYLTQKAGKAGIELK